MTEPRATGVNADRYPTEADARAMLDEGDRDLPYLGIWHAPDHPDRLHMFVQGVTAGQYEANGWTREDEA
jgi:hypothetical protein